MIVSECSCYGVKNELNHGVLAGDMAMSGSGKLKVASMASAAEGVKLPLKP